MALVIKDRVKVTTTTTGTGAVSLSTASATFSAFSDHMSNADTTYYAIVHTTSGTDEWEVGLGTWNTGNTLTRTTVYDGSNGTSAVNFSSGTKDVFMVTPADKSVLKDSSGNLILQNLSNFDTDDLSEGSTNQYYADSLVDAHLSGGTGVTYSSGAISIGQAVGTSDNVTFNNITSTGTVTLAGDPTSALQAATKEYVDTIAAAGIHYHDPVRVEAPSNLNATYNNGSSGVGATLTNAGTQEAITIDGIALSSADRVLVYNQTNAAHNGIYTVTTVGSGSTNWVLTRATDADSYGVSDPNAFGEGDAFFVKEGNTGAGELYVMNTSGTITFGTTNITFTVIAETAVYTAGTGLTLTGTVFSTNQDISTSASPTFAGATINGNITVTGNVDGRDVATDGSKLDGIESGATADQTASEILTAIKTVDGATSGLDADLLDGQHGSYYINTSTTFGGDVSGTYNAIVVADDSHNHVISNVDGLQTALDAKAALAGATFTGGVRHDQDSLTASGGTLTINLSNANNFYITMTASTTFSFTSKDAGRAGNIIIKQNATGGYSFTLPSECKTPVNGASIVQSTGANEISILSYYVLDGSNILVNYIGDFA